MAQIFQLWDWNSEPNPLSANSTNTLKQFVCNLQTTCLNVFDYFMGLALKGSIYESMDILLTALFRFVNCGAIYIFLPSNDKKFLADSRKFFLILSIMFSVLVWRGSRWKNERNMCHVLQDPKVCTWTYKGILNLLFVHDIYTTNFGFVLIFIYLFSRFLVNHGMKLHEKSRKPNSFAFFFFS